MPDESRVMKDRLNEAYQEILVSQKHTTEQQVSTLKVFNLILDNIREGDGSVLSSVWKASVKTLIKLLSYSAFVSGLEPS